MVNKEPGYTTGSTAAAVSKMATEILYTGVKAGSVKIDTPKGIILNIKGECTWITENSVTCFVEKNYSDDPDVTKGIKIFATAERSEVPGIVIKTGKGIGIVTKKGLAVPVGSPAINPVPMKMILGEVGKVLPEGCGVVITLEIPEGEEIAKKTFNSKLGIIGGISILGTSGIVEPMSEEAYKESLKVELNVKVKNSPGDSFIYVFGNFGTDFLKEYSIPESRLQKTSNFIGYMVKAAWEAGIKNLVIVGHAGKMVKLAAGMFNTHSKYGDNRVQSIMESCKHLNLKDRDQIALCNTTEMAIDYLIEINQLNSVFTDIAKRCSQVCQDWTDNKINVSTVIFSSNHGVVSYWGNRFNLLKDKELWSM